MKDYPSNPEEYWQLVDSHWDKLLNITDRFLSLKSIYDGKDLKSHLVELKNNKDPQIARILNEAWWKAPDNPSIHSIPGWNVLCNLCSEEWVLHDQT